MTLNTAGAYVYSCDIHINGGMVAAIVVGDAMPTNIDMIDAALATSRDGPNLRRARNRSIETRTRASLGV